MPLKGRIPDDAAYNKMVSKGRSTNLKATLIRLFLAIFAEIENRRRRQWSMKDRHGSEGPSSFLGRSVPQNLNNNVNLMRSTKVVFFLPRITSSNYYVTDI
jgi:hypothetical protein